MFDQYITQLGSPDPAKRREAIIALGRGGDRRALPGLAHVYRNDPEPTLRDLAFKAGQAIQARQSAAPPPSPVAPPPPTPQRQAPITPLPALPPAPPVPELPPAPRVISDNERKRAKDLLKSAYAYKTRGDDHNALAALARALKLDPEIANDRQAWNLASALVGGSGRDSLDMVLQKADLGELKYDAKGFDSEIIDLLLSLALLFAVIVVFSAALVYGLEALLSQLIFASGGLLVEGGDIQATMQALSFQQAIPDILRVSFISMASTFFQIMITYLMGNQMGGTGNFLRYGRVMLNISTAQYLGFAIGFGLVVVGLFSGGVSSVTFGRLGALALAITVLGGFVATIYYTSRIMEVGVGKAIGIVIVGGVVSGIVSSALGMFDVAQ